MIPLVRPRACDRMCELDRFADVVGCDIGLAVEIGNCARDFQDPIVGAGAEVYVAHGDANQFLRTARTIPMSAPAPAPCAWLGTLLLQPCSTGRVDRRTNASPYRPGRSSFSRNDDR